MDMHDRFIIGASSFESFAIELQLEEFLFALLISNWFSSFVHVPDPFMRSCLVALYNWGWIAFWWCESPPFDLNDRPHEAVQRNGSGAITSGTKNIVSFWMYTVPVPQETAFWFASLVTYITFVWILVVRSCREVYLCVRLDLSHPDRWVNLNK